MKVLHRGVKLVDTLHHTGVTRIVLTGLRQWESLRGLTRLSKMVTKLADFRSFSNLWGLQPDQPSKLPWHLRHASRYTTALSCCGPATLGIWVALWIRPGEGALTLIVVVRGHAVFKTPLSVIFFSSEDPPFHFQALFKLQSLRARIRDPTSIFRNIYIVKPNFCCFSVPETLLMKTWPGWHIRTY